MSFTLTFSEFTTLFVDLFRLLLLPLTIVRPVAAAAVDDDEEGDVDAEEHEENF